MEFEKASILFIAALDARGIVPPIVRNWFKKPVQFMYTVGITYAKVFP